MAAVLAAGRSAVLSHATLRIHRSRTLTPADVTSVRGIAITDPHRTLVDLARTLKGRPLERMVNRAERLIDFERLARTAPPSLQAVLNAYTAITTRSELEERFLELCDEHGIPRPEVSARVEGVEVDGYAFHRSPAAFETDRARDAEFGMRGMDGEAARAHPDHAPRGLGRRRRRALGRASPTSGRVATALRRRRRAARLTTWPRPSLRPPLLRQRRWGSRGSATTRCTC